MSRRLYLANDSSLTTSKTPEEVKIFNDRAQKVFQRLTEQQDCDVGSLCSYPLAVEMGKKYFGGRADEKASQEATSDGFIQSKYSSMPMPTALLNNQISNVRYSLE
ncbi:hypothetical protein WG66_011819, partial [Moniliophthora roreri]